ncbi:MAG: DNA polymerase I [Acidobacteria bacterium]|nr:MAG: DNA polymerase I [Acidobacteriota bacterium]
MPQTKSPAGNGPADRVFLIDSMSHIFRAFYAPMANRAAPLMNSKGQVTQAVYIFTNMLRKLLQDEQPKYITAVFESKEKTFRHETFTDYKANREQMPEDLTAQLPYIKRLCEAYNIPMISVTGFEADDVIGTLATQAAEKGLRAVIVSNDKDMCQLVQDPLVVCMRQNSQVVKRKAPVPPIEWCDETWVLKKFGVPANKLVDLLGLMGDSIDNIPGAPGVGPKGAVQIIQDYGSIENALQHWEEIKNKRYRESLRDNAELIRKSRELAEIKCDIESVMLDLEKLQARPPDRLAAYELFKELEFTNLTNEFADAAKVTVSKVERDYSIVRNQRELDALLEKLWQAEHVGIALSNSSTPGAGQQQSVRDDHGARGIAFAAEAGKSAFVDLENFAEGRDGAIASLKELLTNGLLEKSVHDLKRATALLMPFGIELAGVEEDTLIASYVLDPTRSKYELNDLARDLVGVEGGGPPFEGFSEESWRAAEVADLTAQIARELRKRIDEKDLNSIYHDIELPLAPLLYRMERAGMRVDLNVLAELSHHLGVELEKLTSKICQIAGREFNINSPKQVGECFEALNIVSGRKTSTGRVSTSKAVLEELALTHELPRLIIEYRELEKLKSVYTDALPATGRLSSSDPNLQNIPIRTELGRRIRRAFVAEKGNKLISADYSQLELRLLAHITRDEVMLDAFQKGDDIHNRTSRLVFGAKTDAELKEARRFSKIVNFAIAYAIEPWGLSQRVGISRQEARKVIDDYYATYKGVRRYMDEIPVQAREHGYVRSLYGRIRPLAGINDRNANIRKAAEREAINMPIQGTASDIVKIAMLHADNAFRREGLNAQMLMQVHDELLIECPKNEAETVAATLKREMENAVELDVPLVADTGIGDNWMDAKKQ